ncbi:MAG: TetR family transcriptional regulator, partial [Actinobacteria bacterium]|nr:TetR family transcriptional regulator [Actinomycetota bacterium]
GRWAPDARGRLAAAAMELFEERGYEDTTVADIAARAGLTKRTFFRYFADKREVLFSGTEVLREKFVAGIAAAPADDCPLDAIAAGLEAMADLFDEFGEHPHKRQAIIAANPELQERELIKLSAYAAAAAGALRERGVAEPGASLAAEAGLAVFRIAFEQWTSGPERQDLHQLIRDALAELKAVTVPA